MGPLDALWHLLGFALAPFALAAIAAVLTKLLWRKELRGVGLRPLWLHAGVAAALADLAATALQGRDGRMLSYAAMVLAAAAGLAWAGWGARR
jgi:hypothetical protein